MQEIDERIFGVVDKLKELGLIERMVDLYDIIGIAKQNYYTIRESERAHFTVRHIYNFIHHYNLNPGHIFMDDPQLFRRLVP